MKYYRMFQRNWRLAPTIVVLLAVLLAGACSQTPAGGIETDKVAKNVIVFIGDGIGFNHEEAASCFETGEKDGLAYQKLPVALAMSTYAAGGDYNPDKVWENFNNLKKGATDSAAAGTVMATGRKTYRGAIGVDRNKQRLVNVVEWAETKGKSTGIVSSVQLSHATPAAFVAHNEKRHNFEEIAKEMLGQSAVDVLIGCGHPMYDNNSIKRKEGNYEFVGGEDTWKKLLAGDLGADADRDGQPDPWSFYDDASILLERPTKNLPKRIAVIPPVFTTLQQRREGDPEAAPFEVDYTKNVPTLHQLTGLALEALGRDEDGFFLMVEGGAIDWAGHANQSGRMIEETLDFASSVQVAIDWIENNGGWEENLLIVTSDHETGYLTGPVAGTGDPKRLWTEITCAGKGRIPAMKWNSGGHTNSLVPFYAAGVGAELFQDLARGEDPKWGPYIDNTDIAPVILSLWGVVVER